MDKKKIIIGISSCLLGQNVRYDGKSKRANSIINQFEQMALFLPICPEVEVGMSVPRERVQLSGSLENPLMIPEETRKDWTNAMNGFCQNRILKSDFREISGLILKSKSPSCGIKTTKVYESDTIISEKGSGLFAIIVQQLYPNLPIIDELSLQNTSFCGLFINQAIEYSERK